jgi:hypothetical protein
VTQSRDQICRHTFVPEFGDIEHEKPYLATP